MRPSELEAQLERLHPKSFGWALSCCGHDETEAEDVLQTTYLKIVTGQARFGGRSSLRTWLFGVIRRTAQEVSRKAKADRARTIRLVADDIEDSGEPLTWAEVLALRQIIDSTEDVFDFWEDLLDPVGELVILAIIL